MKPLLNKTYKIVFTDFGAFYNGAETEDIYTIKNAKFIGLKKGKYLFLKDDGNTFTLRKSHFSQMVLNENGETQPNFRFLEREEKKKKLEVETKLKNLTEKPCYFVYCDIPKIIKGKKHYQSYTALQISNTIYYIENEELKKVTASKPGLQVDTFDDIPLNTHPKLIELYNKKKV